MKIITGKMPVIDRQVQCFTKFGAPLHFPPWEDLIYNMVCPLKMLHRETFEDLPRCWCP